MSRITPLLSAAAVALLATACGNNPMSPTAQLKNGSTSKGADSVTSATQPKRQENEEEITLVASTDFPNAVGRAKFEAEDGENEDGAASMGGSDGSGGSGESERELEIQVQGIGTLAGTKVTFSLGGVAIGTAMVGGDGQARLKLESEDGATVPLSVAGLKVEVRTAGAVPIVSGTF